MWNGFAGAGRIGTWKRPIKRTKCETANGLVNGGRNYDERQL